MADTPVETSSPSVHSGSDKENGARHSHSQRGPKSQYQEFLDENMEDQDDYDPNQSFEERQRTKRKYRDLFRDITDNQDVYLRHSDTGLRDAIFRSDKLFRGVKQTNDAMIDAHFVGQAGELALRRAKTLRFDGGAQFDVSECIDKIYDFVKPQFEADVFHWEALGSVILDHAAIPVTMDFLLGPISIEKKKRKVTTNRARYKRYNGEVTRPEEIDAAKAPKQTLGTDVLVKSVAAVLRPLGKVDYFRFCIDPNSFSQSVENMFYVSFLIRDNRALLEDDGDRLLICELADSPPC